MDKVKSLAFIYYKPGDIRVEEKEIYCGPTDLLVKVLASARCGTDKTIFCKGHYKVDSNAPIILGHELTGTIIHVGEKVKTLTEGIGYMEGKIISKKYLNFEIGERVTFQSRIARYQNGLLMLNNPITILSFYIDGGYSQYMKVTKELIQSGSVLRVPESISDEEGALVEPAACVLESIFSTPHSVGIKKDGSHIFKSGVKQGGSVCIIGSGSVSMIYAQLCKVFGATKIHMIVRSEEKKNEVHRILGEGVKVIISPQYNDKPLEEKLEIEDRLVEKLNNMTQEELFDDVIVACPDADAQRLMLKLYNPNGYAVGACFGGTHALVDRVDIDINHYRAAKTVGSSGCSNKAMERIIELLESKVLSLKGFTSLERYTFKTDPDEFFTSAGNGLKPVLYPWGRELLNI
jgi:L-iditol 2-dehydrogenase